MVGLGGFVGAMGRYSISRFIGKFFVFSFYTSTFIVNLLGSFILGLLYSLHACQNYLNTQSMLLLAVGFTGAFTTFSTFCFEIVRLAREKAYWSLLFYFFNSIFLGLLATACGFYLGLLQYHL